MSNYTQITNFTAKDALASGDPLKIIKGSDVDAEFAAIATAIATKADSASPTLTGTVTITGATLAGDATISGAITASGGWTHSGTVTMSGKSMHWAKGADIASAATLVLGSDGNMFDVTGSTGPITAITVPAGMLFMLQFDSTPTLTHHATNLNLPGGVNITANAGDRLIGFATAANQVHVIACTFSATQAQQEAGTSSLVPVTPSVQHYHPSAAKAWVNYNQITPSIDGSYNISSMTDNSTGNATANFTTAFSTATYAAVGMVRHPASQGSFLAEDGDSAIRTTTANRVQVIGHDNVVRDTAVMCIAWFGDQ